MGAWGTGIFEDDDALDWLSCLEGAVSFAPVVAQFDAVLKVDGYVQAPEASGALAAAEVVAAALGRPVGACPAEVEAFAARAPSPGLDVVRKAIAAVNRAIDSSELAELWEDTDSFEAWQKVIVDLRNRLNV